MNRDRSIQIQDVVREAFLAVHQGRSTDDVLIDDELNRRFIAMCQRQIAASECELNWKLINLRKAGSLGRVTTVKPRADHDDYIHAAEFSARHVEDKYSLTVDRILCNPHHRREFDREAQRLAPDVSPYLLRKAALSLRKAGKLQPEYVKRVSDWGRKMDRFDALDLRNHPDKLPSAPGVYLFCDSTGYLYIGEAQNLRKRVSKHLDHSDRKALAWYLWEKGVEGLIVEVHWFDVKSNGRLKAHRCAYETDLIQKRRPKFNIQR